MRAPRDQTGDGVRLVWPGRAASDRLTDEPGPPLGIVERWPVTAGAAHAVGSATLVAGDALPVLASWRAGDPALPAAPVRLIYLDPPFATGTTFAANIPVGERRPGQPTLQLPAYRDVWAGGLAGYLTAMEGLLTGLRAVLADDGWLCLHCDHRASAHLRLLLDELFGPEAFRNEIVWSYGLGNGTSRRGFPRKHDTLLLYAKSDAARFMPVRGAVSPAMANKYRHVRPDGTRFMRSYGREYDLKGGKPVGSVWDIPSVAPTSAERTGYPTQKPLALLERLIAATTAPGDLVLDPCCGSGTTLLAAARLGRPAVGIDPSPLAIATTRSRLVGHGIGLDVVHPAPMAAIGDGDRLVGERPWGGLAVAPTRRYHLDAVAALASTPSDQDERKLTISLSGLTVTPQLSTGLDSPWTVHDGRLIGAAGLAPVTETWTDWIEGWAVQLGEGDDHRNGPFNAAAATFRTGRQRSLTTTLTVPMPGDEAVAPVIVRIYDLFGAASDHVVRVT